MARATLSLLGLFLLASSAGAAPLAGTKVDYNFQIRPLLSDRCFVCHGPDPKTRKADLRLDTREGALASKVFVPGKPDESELVRRICADDADRMPPRKSNLSLSPAEIELLRRWIAEGAEYKPHWAFLPLPDKVPSPPVSDEKWPRTRLDRFVLARLDAEKLKPSPEASREDWIRRVTFDLTGLPATPEEVDNFLADKGDKAYEIVVDRLLTSKRYGERMAVDWLDVARYADSFGYQSDADTNVWPYRDWVIGAFNANLRYDQFLTWQLAGDRLPRATREQRLATAFNRLHRMTGEGGSIPEEWRLEYVADRVHTFGTAVLGLTFECARCHDHKYDPITQRDYYALSSFFNSIDEWGTYDSAAFRPTPTLPLPTPAQEQALASQAEAVKVKEATLARVRGESETAFKLWLAKDGLKPEIPGLVGSFALDRPTSGQALANRIEGKPAGANSPANTFVEGKLGQAIRFTGDDPVNFPNLLGSLERHQSWTMSFWLNLPERMKSAIVFHRMSGTDTGFHGTECSLDDGRLQIALVRFWPGNAIALRTKEPLPEKRWVHVAVGYDGSSMAAGLRLWVDGKPAAAEVVRDHLTRDLQAGGSGPSFGERFRSIGLKGVLFDELHIADRLLADVEVAHLFDGKALAVALEKKDTTALREYYLAALDPEMTKARAELTVARQQFFATQTGVNEIMTMEEMPAPRTAYILKRGEYDAPRDRPVERATPASLPPFPDGAPRDRLGLARWLTQPRHPLTARVAVNRFWQHFFGRGIVPTPDNFGIQGALPSHPELLDALARDFIDSGWDVKGLVKNIVLSATYRQRSSATPELREHDPDNVLLGRGPARRLSAEMLRDTALFAGGLLVEKVGGPSVKPYSPGDLWRATNAFLPAYVADKGEGLYRRSMYTFWRRTAPPPNMLAFDAPSREVCVARRQPTSTPLQPLVLLNDPTFVEAARGLGERLLRRSGTIEEKLTWAFRVTATRAPTEREQALLLKAYQEQKARFEKEPEAARKYLSVGDRPMAKDLALPELAAASVVANALLNLDAAVMVR
jgi:hypothetical protein